VEARAPAINTPDSPPVTRAQAEVSSGTARVVMETTPAAALAPYSDDPGPRITSMRWMSSSSMGCISQADWPNSSMLASRPSTRTR
jgi:hypothetical protein